MTTRAPEGLRERKKRQTREALSWAALRLSVERGFGNVLVEDIAAEAGVSARTFNNYFASKAEAIVWRHLDRVHRIAALLRERPAEESVWEAVTEALVTPFHGDRLPPPEWITGVRRLLTEPAMQGEFIIASADAEHDCATAVAERTGLDPDDIYPLLVAGAIGTAIRVAQHQWLRADPPVPLEPLIRDAIHLLTAGLPDPGTR
jgi:AcrR family transcriptional regulator